MNLYDLEDLLRQRGCKVCTAESFTGGGIAARLTSIPGSSDVFGCGLVCYSNEAKCGILGVDRATIDTFGAVSDHTVSEMLDGLCNKNLGDIFIATSGNAGPSAEKDEVGLIFVGIMFNGNKLIKRYQLTGSRKEITEQGCLLALEMLENLLIEKKF